MAAGGGVAAVGGSSAVFLRLRNIVIGSCFVDEDALINSHDVINTIAEFDGSYHVIIHFLSPFWRSLATLKTREALNPRITTRLYRLIPSSINKSTDIPNCKMIY